MSKGGGKQHTPYEARDNLKSTQELSVIDVVSEGPIEGPINGLQGLRLNDTPVIDAQGGVNVHGVKAEWRAGEEEQTPLTDFDGSASETIISAEVTHDKPITRTITSETVDRLRVTVGVQALVRTTDQGDRLEDTVQLDIQIQRSGVWLTEKTVIINGKRTSPFMTAVLMDNLPPRPFNLRVVRVTPDSTTDTLQNKTVWQGLTEIINITQSYPNTALVGLKVDADQFGSQSVSRKFHLRGRIVRVPSNYDPIARTYDGLWNGAFKPAWTNNPAWQLLDLLTHPRYGLGQRIGLAQVDKWALYAIAQYCDQSVPDGFGGTEPRMTCNAYLADRRKAYDVISDFCSVMRCMPVWNGQRMTFVQDRPTDKVWTYTNANVVNGEFKYSYSAAKDRHNVAEVRFVDPVNGWDVSVELVENKADIQKNGRKVTQIDAFGCTRRGQAHRTGLWAIQTALLETQMVSFGVGAEGLRHIPGDIIEVCDNDYAGASIGGRVVAVDTARRTLTLDRDIELSGTGTGANVMRFIGANGKPLSATVTLQPDKNKVVLNAPLEGIMDGSVWGLKPATLRRRLFRCVAIAEKEDGSYSISALQHVPEKEAIVDKGTTFDLEEVKATVLSQTPPEVLHLTADIQPATDGYQITAHWDTPQLIKGGQFQVKLLTQDIEPRLVSQAITTETTYTFRELTQGDYTLCVRAMNAEGRLGEATQIAVPIHAPAAPIDVKAESGFYSVTLTPRLALIPQVPTQFDFYFVGEGPLTTVGEVERLGAYQGTGTSWTTSDLRVGIPYYWYVRTVNVLGKSDWVEVVASCQTNAKSLLDDFTGQITKTQLGQDVLSEIDTKAAQVDVETAVTTLTNRLMQETQARQTAFVQESQQRADVLLLEQRQREASVSTLAEQVETAKAVLSRQLSQVVAGTGEQFDAVKIWHFNQGTTEGWTANGGLATVTSDGALRPANHLLDPFVVSPSGLAIDAVTYRFVKFRVIRVGKPVWDGKLYWRAPGAAFSERCSQVLPVVIFDAHQSATVTLKDIPWAQEKNIESIRLDLSSQQTATDYFLIDWIAIGRPTPGAGLAALEAEQLARSQGDEQEARQRQLLATQLRGSYEGSNLALVSTGLIAQERQARTAADSVEASTREALKTQFNQSISTISNSLNTLNTQNSAQANEMTAIKASLQGKADNSALVSKADATALNNLTTRVTSAEGTITTQGQQITSLSNSLPGKADATALNNLATRVTSAEGKLTTQSTSVTQLSNSLTSLTGRVNVLDTEKVTLLDLATLDANTWYPVTLNLDSSTKRWSFRLYRSLRSVYAPHPSWGKHSSGFSLELAWSVMGSGWGAQDIERLIDAFQYLWVKDDLSPVMGPTQMTHSSTEVIYLRGGARYHLVTDKTVTPTVRTTLYTNNGDSVSPRTYDVNLVPKTINQRGEATANATDTLKTLVSTINGQVTAQATQISTLSVQMGSQQAAVQQTASALTTLDGKVRAKAGLKVQANSAGKKVVTGIEMEATSAGDSQLLIKADTFAVISALNGQIMTPFMVNAAGQVVMNEALLQNLILSASMRSVNYIPGKSGFNLDAKTGLLSIFGGVGVISTEVSNGGFYVKEGLNYLVEMGLFKP